MKGIRSTIDPRPSRANCSHFARGRPSRLRRFLNQRGVAENIVRSAVDWQITRRNESKINVAGPFSRRSGQFRRICPTSIQRFVYKRFTGQKITASLFRGVAHCRFSAKPQNTFPAITLSIVVRVCLSFCYQTIVSIGIFTVPQRVFFSSGESLNPSSFVRF